MNNPNITLPNQWGLGNDFMYHNAVPFRLVLYLARLPVLIIGLLLGILIYFTGRRWFSSTAGLFALALYAFCPTVLAHAHLATSDIAAATWYVLCCFCIALYLDNPKTRNLIFLTLAIGSAQLVKFNLLSIFGIYVIAGLITFIPSIRKSYGTFTIKKFAIGLIVTLIVWLALVFSAYQLQSFHVADFPKDPENVYFNNIKSAQDYPTIQKTISNIAFNVSLPAYWYWEGIARLVVHEYGGHSSFLLGQTGKTGWWYYFPVAFAAKTSTAMIIFLLWFCVSKIRENALTAFRGKPKIKSGKQPFLLVITIALALYTFVSIRSHINIGVRHLLPMYPLLMLALGAFLARRWTGGGKVTRGLIILVFVFHAATTIYVFPRYLSYFNLFAGGEKTGPSIISDSNADWSQGLFALAKYLHTNNITDYAFAFYGNADLEAYGIDPTYFPQKDQTEDMPKYVIISTSRVYPEKETFGWIDAKYKQIGVIYGVYQVYLLISTP